MEDFNNLYFKILDESFKKSHVMLSITHLKSGQIMSVNRSFLDRLGFSKEEVSGKTSKEMGVFADDRDRERAFSKFIRTGSLVNHEIRMKCKNGEIINTLLSINSIEAENEIYLLSSVTDITPLKIAESKLNTMYYGQKLISDITRLLHMSPDCQSDFENVLAMVGEHTGVSRVYIFKDDAGGATTSVKYEWCKSGVSPTKEDMQGISYSTFPGFKELLISNTAKFFISDSLPDSIKEITDLQNIITFMVAPLYVEGNYFGFIGFDECTHKRVWSEDITDLLESIASILSNFLEKDIVMNRLRTSEIRLKFAIDSAKEGLWDWDNRTGDTYYNDNYYLNLGYLPGEFKGVINSWADRIHPQERESVLETLQRHVSGETPFYEATYQLKRKDGSWMWVLDRGMVVKRDLEGNPLRTIGTNINITEHKETEIKLNEALRTKDKLFSIISHDLRGPVSNLLPMLDLLTGDIELDSDQRSQFINYIKEASRNTFELLENLLIWSKSQTGTISLSRDNFSLEEVLSKNIQLISAAARQKEITLALKISAPMNVFADKESVNLITRNLLTNAVKFTPKGGRITISTSSSAGFANIEISDTGSGIDESILAGLFSVNSFTGNNGYGNSSGSGLGLILCKDFVELNGGKIKAENIDGGGSRFTYTIPLER
jgi:PAS domain S-box-containing protein